MGQYSVVKELGRVKRSLGICPQFDCLFDLLTVEEHLDFYSQVWNLQTHAHAHSHTHTHTHTHIHT